MTFPVNLGYSLAIGGKPPTRESPAYLEEAGFLAGGFPPIARCILIRRFQHHIKSLYHLNFLGPCQVYIQSLGVESCRSTVRKRSPSPPDRSLLCDRSIRIVLSPDWSIRRIPSFGLALPVQLFIVSSMLLKKRRFLFAFFLQKITGAIL